MLSIQLISISVIIKNNLLVMKLQSKGGNYKTNIFFFLLLSFDEPEKYKVQIKFLLFFFQSKGIANLRIYHY